MSEQPTEGQVMSEQEIADAEKRCQAATPGEWVLDDWGGIFYIRPNKGEIPIGQAILQPPKYGEIGYDWEQTRLNGEFYTHSRTDILNLIATIRTLQARLKAVEGERDALQERLDELNEPDLDYNY
jgi:hypothetical protein